jgi:hypothetical protein
MVAVTTLHDLWAGCPARLTRKVKPEELKFIRTNGPNYCETCEQLSDAS